MKHLLLLFLLALICISSNIGAQESKIEEKKDATKDLSIQTVKNDDPATKTEEKVESQKETLQDTSETTEEKAQDLQKKTDEEKSKTETKQELQEYEDNDGDSGEPSEESPETKKLLDQTSTESATIQIPEYKSEEQEPVPALTPQEETKQDSDKWNRSVFVITYNLAQPLSSTKDFINSFSYEGFGFDYRFSITKEISAKIGFSWSSFSLKESGSFELENATISGTRIRVLDSMPIHMGIFYNFVNPDQKIIPHVGLNFGPAYVNRVIDYAWWYDKESSWHFSISPEIALRLSKMAIPLYFSMRYNYLLKSKSDPSQKYLSFNIGIALER